LSKKRSRPVSTVRKAPLADADADALNRAFYGADPGAYFGMRLRALVEASSQTEAEYRAHTQTFRFGEFELTVTPATQADPADQRARDQYVLIEAEMLLHHLAETLLRLYIGHVDAPRVPWLTMDAIRGPGDLKGRVKRLIADNNAESLRRGAGFVWLGDAEQATVEWVAATTTLAGYLNYFGHLFLDRAPVYNAAKHGLAVQAGDSRLSISGIPELTQEGPSLAWLASDLKEGVQHLVVRNQWVDHQRELALFSVGCDLINGLWAVGRTRYVGWPAPVEVKIPEAVNDVLAAGRTATSLVTMGVVSFPPWMYSPAGSGADALRPDAAAESN
jgi:hypothetical protein